MKNDLISQKFLCEPTFFYYTQIHKSFDDGFNVRNVFLDISKVFDKIWPEGITFKLKQNSISAKLLNLCDFFKEQKTMLKHDQC